MNRSNLTPLPPSPLRREGEIAHKTPLSMQWRGAGGEVLPFIILGGFGAAIAIALLALIFFGPQSIRFGAALGVIGLLVAAQIVVLFVRPQDRTPFGAARRAFSTGEYEASARLLEPIAEERPTLRVLTLLGNTYRQMGRYSEAREQLERAIAIAPHDASILYGLGRVSLAQGDFEAAADWFDQALAAGAPSAIGCDLGLAEYCSGREDAARQILQKVTRVLQIELHRQWLANALLSVLLSSLTPAASTPPRYEVERGLGGEVLRANLRHTANGRAYWEAEADRHSATPYGAALHTMLTTFDQIDQNQGENDAIRHSTIV